MSELFQRRQYTNGKIKEIQGFLKSSEHLVEGVACVYATGSYGRHEASEGSDLDLFIVSKARGVKDSHSSATFSNLNEILLKSNLILATREFNIKDFDGDGRYLTHYTIDELKKNLGSPKDDALNTFTARLLLLLESNPLIGHDVYNCAIEGVIESYWRDYQGHEKDFVPAFLANDILRLWRTFCVNYEARTEDTPLPMKIKRRQKNYTLKHSRLLTCYSAILFLLYLYNKNNTVSKEDVKAMVLRSPTQRLEMIAEDASQKKASKVIKLILNKYEEFLHVKNNKATFDRMFSSDEEFRKNMTSASQFADLFFDAIEMVGKKNRMHRLVLV